MFTLASYKAAATVIAFLPGVLSDSLRKPLRELPTPAALGQEITTRMLNNYRKSLAATVELRKKYEQTPDTRATEIAKLKAWEADFRQRIERLEKGMLTPPRPLMPVVPSGRPLPKPPVRD